MIYPHAYILRFAKIVLRSLKTAYSIKKTKNKKGKKMNIEKNMKTSSEGLDLIRKYEKFRSEPYLDVVGKPTIGWGNTFYENGVAVTMNDESISRERGDRLNEYWLQFFEKEVTKAVRKPLKQCQFDALVSLVYNIGHFNFRSSTLLKKINANPNDCDILYQFERWNKGRVKGVLKVINGLTKRRLEEASMYFSYMDFCKGG